MPQFFPKLDLASRKALDDMGSYLSSPIREHRVARSNEVHSSEEVKRRVLNLQNSSYASGMSFVIPRMSLIGYNYLL